MSLLFTSVYQLPTFSENGVTFLDCEYLSHRDRDRDRDRYRYRYRYRIPRMHKGGIFFDRVVSAAKRYSAR